MYCTVIEYNTSCSAKAISHMSGIGNFLVYSLFEFAGAALAAGMFQVTHAERLA